jgi:NAD(P)-dependent dehydrogenase (short-subunit alcohol dehydrogenase family)
VAGVLGFHQGSAYAATKHAVEGLTKSIAEEVAAAVLYLGQCAFGQKKVAARKNARQAEVYCAIV